MHSMPPAVYIDEAVDFEGEGCNWVESVGSSSGGAWKLGIGMVGKEGVVHGGC